MKDVIIRTLPWVCLIVSPLLVSLVISVVRDIRRHNRWRAMAEAARAKAEAERFSQQPPRKEAMPNSDT
jgi:hypothetical protein